MLSDICLTLAFILSVAFNMGTDMVDILSNPIGQPMATVSQRHIYISALDSNEAFQIIFNSLGMRGTLAIWSLIIVTMYVLLLCSKTSVLNRTTNSNMASMNVASNLRNLQ